MGNDINKLAEIEQHLADLLKRQDEFSKEIKNLQQEIKNLKPQEVHTNPIAREQVVESKRSSDTTFQPNTLPIDHDFLIKKNVEKFIGEHLTSTIGIIIIIIGVGIGAKYSIERGLMSPLFRIILGYLAGCSLLGVGVWLKQKYKNFSAVLVSGAMAIMYFISYAAYDFYDLIPQIPVFILMVFLTVVTAAAAIVYNRQIIAHIGMVGAYAVPFLLSSGSGNTLVLFTYMLIINGGILYLSFKKYWQPLYYSSSGITWLIYLIWYALRYNAEQDFTLAFVFLALFFILFYVTFIAYKLGKKEKFILGDITLLLSNSFIFYAFGYTLLNQHQTGSEYLGVFTLCNTVVHGAMGVFAYLHKAADKKLLYLLMGLAVVFATITIPVQLSGSWVTLLWLGEAILLFGLGRMKSIAIYERLSYPLMLATLVSLLHDWINVETGTPFININFLISMLFIAGFAFINNLYWSQKSSALPKDSIAASVANTLLPIILIGVTYFTFFFEIERCWNDAITVLSWKYRTIWLINYTLMFVSLLSVISIIKIKNTTFSIINLAINMLAVLVFLSLGLSELNSLSNASQNGAAFDIAIRYISIALAALTLLASNLFAKQDYIQKPFKTFLELALHSSLLCIVSNELLHWFNQANIEQADRLWLSMLLGLYAFMLVVLGIWKKKKHLRISAIFLFGATLVKLFTYDILQMSTVAKTVAFISLGVLLLIISFSYNKYKHLIFDEDKE